MASQVSGYVGRMDPGDGVNYAIGSTAYGYCETAADTKAKIVDMTGFTLVTGATIHVKFKYSNTATTPTLNVNSTGGKNIYRYGTTVVGNTAETSWDANSIVTLTYDGTGWVIDAFKVSNTTYTFSGGTNKFTVTPSNGDAQDVTITPSISNNVTGSGTNGSLTKFDGTNTITDGPALGSDTTKYLRNDGTWAVPPDNNTWTALVGATSSADGTGGYISATPPSSGYNEKYFRADGTWVKPPNDNTTYTFAGGTNKFTVTPSGGTSTDVTVTPSITDNVTGSGTSGYLTKFNGTNTITSGPQLGSDTTTFLRNDGTWATPGGGGTVTSVSSGVGLTGGPVTTSGTIKANLVSETALTNSATAATEVAGRVYPVAVDADGALAVNVPWDNTTYDAMSSTEATTGTATTSRVMTAAVLKTAIEAKFSYSYNSTSETLTLPFF